MKLTKLELFGFKSFALKTELHFSNGITAVIGPNGSGKSNIADAIRWVLGEQSAKALRGTKMDDVIFNGTQQRKSSGYCEVVLTFDNSDGALPISFREVAISRRLYRNAESEYCINGNVCRLKDVQELFRDTGIGKDGYSIISQGKVEEILSNKSNERRVALEEAAGVMRYRVRKEEAVRKLDNTEKNLVRLEDIISEIESRIEPLAEQSKIAKEFLKLRDELKDLEINQFLYLYDRDTEKLKSNDSIISGITKRKEEIANESVSLQKEYSALEERNSEIENVLTNGQNSLMEAMASIENQIGQKNLLLQKLEQLKAERDRLFNEKSDFQNRISRLEETLVIAESNLQKNELVQQLDVEIEQAEKDISSQDSALVIAEDRLNNLKSQIVEAMNLLADSKSDISRFETMTESLQSRQEQIKVELDSIGKSTEQLGKEKAEVQTECEEIEDKIKQNRIRLKEEFDLKDTLQEEYRKQSEEHNNLIQECGRTETRLHLLSEMEHTHEGYMNSVRSLLDHSSRDIRIKNAIVGVVADLIRVPQKYENAINMSLGSSLQNIVTRSAEEAKYLIDYLRTNDLGRATFLPISLLRVQELTPEEKSALKEDECIGLACDLIEYDSSVSDVIRYLLGKTVLVADIGDGIKLKKKGSGSLQIASLSGDIIANNGSMSGGSIKKREISIIGRKREIKELSDALNKKQAEAFDAENRCISILGKINDSDKRLDELRDGHHELEISRAKALEKLDIIVRDIENVSVRQGQLNDETEQILENLQDIQNSREASLLIKKKIEEGNVASNEDISKAQTELMELRTKHEAALERISDLKVRRMSLQKEQDAVLAEKKRLSEEISDIKKRIDSIENEIGNSAANETAIETELKEVESLIEAGRIKTDSQRESQQENEKEKNSILEIISEYRERRDNLLLELRKLDEEQHKCELSSSRIEMELDNLHSRIWEEYELTLDNCEQFRHAYSPGASNTRINEIKGEIRSFGDVNVSSIEDYSAVTSRYEQLTTQRDDLVKAKSDLEILIRDLTDTMKDNFTEKFTIIQQNFSEVFKQLFGGGNAEIVLSDKNNVLECDIDIIAQPPGKKLQLLSLLSGGERALTAIALLFAMLRLKSPSFCVLDEIESSLDEVNVSRFAQYLKEYSADTQFIIVTHRKGSMEVCNSLYGVSMEERGISKVVSAKFDGEKYGT